MTLHPIVELMMCRIYSVDTNTTGLKVATGMHAHVFHLALQLCESINFSQAHPADL